MKVSFAKNSVAVTFFLSLLQVVIWAIPRRFFPEKQRQQEKHCVTIPEIADLTDPTKTPNPTKFCFSRPHPSLSRGLGGGGTPYKKYGGACRTC